MDVDGVLASTPCALPSPEAGAGASPADALPAGPALATWLSGLDPAAVSGRDLITMAAAFRRVAAWAQAGELAAVAEVAARSAAVDPRAGLQADGRPACVTDDAAAQVSLGLTLSHYGAESWTSLSVALRWRLPRTAAALAAGQIDLLRARILAEAIVPLTDAAARTVEDAVLPRAADLTYTQMRAATRRAVIAADPEGAEHRRQEAERRAKVSLYPEQDCTATLTGTGLPAALASAAMARLSAMARARRASGASGGLDLLRAQIFIGLILGTMPPIPPPADGPPDADPPDDDPPGSDVPDADLPGSDRPDAERPGSGPSGNDRPDADSPASGRPGAKRPRSGRAERERYADARGPRAGTGSPPGASDPSSGDGPAGGASQPADADHPGDTSRAADADPADDAAHGDQASRSGADGGADPARDTSAGGAAAPGPDAPPLTDADLPEDDGYRDRAPPGPDACAERNRAWGDPLDDDFPSDSSLPLWPPAPPVIPAGLPDSAAVCSANSPGSATEPEGPGHAGAWRDLSTRDSARPEAGGRDTGGREAAARDGSGRHSAGRPPAGGLLDLTLPWATLTGAADQPGMLGRIGPVTATQAREMVRLALCGYRTEWRVIVADAAGSAMAVGRVRRRRPPPGADGPGLMGVVGRVTVVVPATDLDRLADLRKRPGGRLLARLVAAGVRALAQARVLAEGDREAAGGCAHATASAAYRPPPRLREHVIARDQTCRYPFCGQPAWRGDLDHTHPWQDGGKTCRCNLGGLCRRHHRLKQRTGWRLTQPQPGVFLWVTPAGLTYRVQPDPQPG